jgi:hypothetical protein
MTAPEVSATDVYALGRDPAESARLRRQSYEGTREINQLIVGRAITGEGAFV